MVNTDEAKQRFYRPTIMMLAKNEPVTWIQEIEDNTGRTSQAYCWIDELGPKGLPFADIPALVTAVERLIAYDDDNAWEECETALNALIVEEA
jgi:hypothetical protein